MKNRPVMGFIVDIFGTTSVRLNCLVSIEPSINHKTKRHKTLTFSLNHAKM